jgi:hypothetical protein
MKNKKGRREMDEYNPTNPTANTRKSLISNIIGNSFFMFSNFAMTGPTPKKIKNGRLPVCLCRKGV